MSYDRGEARLNASQSCPVATETVNAEGLRIESFNGSVAMVSIEVMGGRSGTLLNRALISDHVGDLTFPISDPTGWNPSRDFNVTIFSEGVNATVDIEYAELRVAHADGSAEYILPDFYQTQNLRFLLLEAGLVVLVVGIGVILARNRR